MKTWLVGMVIGAFATVLLTEVFTKGFSAHLKPDETSLHVLIDGIDFGTFSSSIDPRSLKDSKGSSGKIFTLGRTFVTNPSYFEWTQRSISTKPGLQHIQLVAKNSSGGEVSRYVFLGKPLKWTVGKEAQGTGAFYENIELAVQDLKEISPK